MMLFVIKDAELIHVVLNHNLFSQSLENADKISKFQSHGLSTQKAEKSPVDNHPPIFKTTLSPNKPHGGHTQFLLPSLPWTCWCCLESPACPLPLGGQVAQMHPSTAPLGLCPMGTLGENLRGIANTIIMSLVIGTFD